MLNLVRLGFDQKGETFKIGIKEIKHSKEIISFIYNSFLRMLVKSFIFNQVISF